MKEIQKDTSVCAWQAVLKTVQGRQVLWQLLQSTQPDHHGFVPNDALSTAFHCGQHSIGLFIRQQIEKVMPQALMQMQQEYQAELAKKQAELEKQQEETYE